GFMTEVLLGNRQFKFSIVFGHEKTPKVGVQHLGVTSMQGFFYRSSSYQLHTPASNKKPH
ncbi:MAG: hypothetical protein U9R28_04330, partial [Pseudomonadota bacterium]|nr:hypothetical protein [Pseudomonadota bacterium]